MRLRHALIACLALLVAACAAERPLIPPPLELPAKARQGTDIQSLGGEQQAREMRVVPTPAPPVQEAPAQPAPTQKPPGAPEKADITLSFEQVPLPSFVQVVYANILKRNVNVDPAVASRQDLVTLRTGRPQTPSEVAELARTLLRSYGVAVVEAGDLVRIVPDTANLGYAPEIRLGRALPTTPGRLRPVFQLVDLTAVQKTEAVNWLKAIFEKRIDVKEDTLQNAILISGKSDDVAAALEALRVLDQPLMKGRASIRISPVYWPVEELARRLSDLLRAEGYNAGVPQGTTATTAVTLLPVPGANALFVFAGDQKIIDHVVQWARDLDTPNERGAGRNIFSYRVQYTDAEVLSRTLQQVLAGGPGGSTTTPSPAASSPPPVAGTPTAVAAMSALARNAAAAVSPAARAVAGSVIVDRATNTIIFHGAPEDFGDIRNLLQVLDRPAKEALIEVTVAEVTLTDDSQLGIEWLVKEAGLANGRSIQYGTLGGLTLGTGGFNFRLFDNAGDVRAIINALASTNRATILSSPRVLARNGESANIQVGQEVPIITSQQVAVNSGVISTTTTAVPQTIQYRNTGVILTVKPVIYSGDRV
ncbi:MAG: secretin N-terminal domain-containing protein, partial [Betaproteobacteria bacterium]